MSSDYDSFINKSQLNRRAVYQEELILKVTQAICEVMHSTGVKQSELARRLEKSEALVSQTLAGSRNMTLRTLADIADAIGCTVELRLITNPIHRGR